MTSFIYKFWPNPLAPKRVKLAKLLFDDSKKLDFYNDLSAMMENGVALQDALLELNRCSREDKKWIEETFFASLLSQEGIPLHTKLKPWVTIEHVMIIEANSGGNLKGALDCCCELIESKKELTDAVGSAAQEPIQLLVMFCILFAFMSNFVLPTFAEFVPPEQWTGNARMLYYIYCIGNSSYSMFITLFMLGLIGLIYWSFPRWTGNTRTFFDKIPPWSIYKLLIGSSWMLSLSALLSSGKPIVEALKGLHYTVQNSNPWLAERIYATLVKKNEGITFGQALKKTGYDFPDKNVVSKLAFYSELQNFPRTLENIATRNKKEGIKKIKKKIEIIKHIVTFAVAFLYISLAMGLTHIEGQATTTLIN